MGFLKKIVHFLANLCYLLIIIYGLLCVPICFGYKPLVVLTGSMEPTYKVGSIVYYHKTSEIKLSVNDVITFAYEDNLIITHRIYKINGDEYITKGDANNAPDPVPITYKNILGKVTNITIPYLGYYVRFINEHLYIIGIVVIILVSEFLLSNVRTFDIKKNRKDERHGI